MDLFAAIVVTLEILLLLGALALYIFIITLLWRTTVALERGSRHLYEIAKDLKKLSHHFREEDKDDADEKE